VDQDVIKIVDLDPGSNSVTNDAERVLRKIECWPPGLIVRCRIMYRDSLGTWDGIEWDGQGVRFFPIREKGMKRQQRASSDRLTDRPVVDKYAQKRQRVSLEPARHPGLNLFAGTCKTR
jgi:hypothetical protein